MSDIASGFVTQIYPPGKSWLNFKLSDSESVPMDGFFQIMQSHPNYKEAYSLLLAAAINRLTVNVRAADTIKSTEYAEVAGIWVNWS